jgi:hypothetical protein
MRSTQLTAEVMKDNFKLKVEGYKRETLFRISFASITGSSTLYDSEFDGYLGLAPYSADRNNFMYNFLY